MGTRAISELTSVENIVSTDLLLISRHTDDGKLISYNSSMSAVSQYVSSEMSNGIYDPIPASYDLCGIMQVGTGLSVDDGYVWTYANAIPLSDSGSLSNVTIYDQLIELSTETQEKITGDKGDVAYVDSDDEIVTKQICQKLWVCETEAEVEECKGQYHDTQKEIFNNWTKFGCFANRLGDLPKEQYIQNGINSEVMSTDYYVQNMKDSGCINWMGVTHWSYDVTNDVITQDVNAEDFTGYVSDSSYRDYSFECRFWSTDKGDDDENGIVAAYIVDSSGQLHTISFVRTPNDAQDQSQQYHWYCMLDAVYTMTPTWTTYNIGSTVCSLPQKILKNSSLTIDNDSHGKWGTWAEYGVRLYVERHGNVFTCKTTNFANIESDCKYKDETLTIDLEQLIEDPEFEEQKDILKLFIDKPVHVGVFSQSQPYSRFEILSFSRDATTILDLSSNVVLQYDRSSKTWKEIDTTPIDYMGYGRLAFNSITEKTFYNSGTNIYKISTISQGHDDTKQDKITGEDGDVAYISNDTVVTQQICRKLWVCQNEEEVLCCINSFTTTQKDIFDTWTKFGNVADQQYIQNGLTAEPISDDNYYIYSTKDHDNWCGVQHWMYDTANSLIYMQTNCEDFTGYVSRNSYNDYVFECRFWSENGGTAEDEQLGATYDDDFNGIVAAYAVDAEGRQHTLSFLRSPQYGQSDIQNTHWFCVLDAKNMFSIYTGKWQYKTQWFALSQKLVKNSSTLNLASEIPTAARGKGWYYFKDYGTKLKVVRTGNVFTCYATKFSTTETDYADEVMTVDLDELYENSDYSAWKDVLSLFIDKPVHIGVCTESQAKSKFEIIQFPQFDYDILDLEQNTVSSYNYSSHKWELQTGEIPLDYMGYGRMAYNNITQKTYYDDGYEIYDIGSKTAGTVKSVNGKTADSNGAIELSASDISMSDGTDLEEAVTEIYSLINEQKTYLDATV